MISTIIILSTLVYINYDKTEQAVNWNTHSFLVLNDFNKLLLSMVNMETGERGFVITGQDNFLEPFHSGKTSFNKTFQDVKNLTNDNPKQQDNLEQIQEAE